MAAFRPGAPFEALAKARLEMERPRQALTVDDLDRRVQELLSNGLDRLGPQLITFKGDVLLFADQLEEILDPVIFTRKSGKRSLTGIGSLQLRAAAYMLCVPSDDPALTIRLSEPAGP